MRTLRLAATFVVALGLVAGAACSYFGRGEGATTSADTTSTCSVDAVGVSAQPYFPNLQFNIPTSFVRTPDSSTGVVTEKAGVVKAFPNLQTAGPADVRVMIDFSNRVNSNAREPGVNGLAFHPQWPTVPEAYITYDGFPNGQANQWEWRLSRFISKDGGQTLDSDPAHETILLRSVKIASEHNGGQLVFHPTEVGRTGVPLLYVSVGDSENAFGPAGNAQNLNTFFGKFLRLDILDEATRAQTNPRTEFDAPADNPFASGGTNPGAGLPIIYSWGHRNPWRWTFDQHNGQTDIWLGEVGQDAFDSVHLVTKGGNYGWNLFESRHPGFCGNGQQCDPTKLLGTCSATLSNVSSCAAAEKRCGSTFTFPFNGETSVELRGDFTNPQWAVGNPMTHSGNVWTVGVTVPFNQPVVYKFLVNGSQWETDPNNPNTQTDPQGNVNSVQSPTSCASPSCAAVPCVGGHITQPVLELPHQANPNDPTTANAGGYLLSSVTGGFVYRGTVPGLEPLVGHYIYADFETGNLFSFNPQNPSEAPINIGITDQVTSWQVDNTDGGLITVGFHGRLGKLVRNGCPVAFNPNGRHYIFLSKQGIGTEFSAWNYYQAANSAAGTLHNDIPIVGTVQNPPPPAGFNPELPDGGFTFLVQKPAYSRNDWKKQFMSASPLVTALYKNNLDLGFWRQMVCTQTFAPGQGGCAVTNWPATDANGNPIEPTPAQLSDDSQTDLGTVTMNISPDGFVRFYVFQGAPPHDLQPFAILDNEGVKFAPQLCTPCHGGNSAGSADLGSVFREFEPVALVKRAEITQAQAEQEWFALNQAVRGANQQLTGNATSPLTTGVSAQSVIVNYLGSMYPTGAPPAVPLTDVSRIPPSYLTDPAGSALVTAKSNLWTEGVGHYCIGCHRLNNIDLTNYAEVNTLAVSNGSRSLLEQYFEPTASDPLRQRLVIMPQSSLQDQLLLADSPARGAIDSWLAALSSTQNTPMCAVSWEIETDINLPVFDPATEWLRIIGTTQPLPPGMPDPISNWNSAAPGLNLTIEGDGKHWIGTGVFPQGSTLSYQGSVGKNESLRFEFSFGQPNRTFTVPTGRESVDIKFRWGTQPGTETVQ